MNKQTTVSISKFDLVHSCIWPGQGSGTFIVHKIRFLLICLMNQKYIDQYRENNKTPEVTAGS